VRYTERLFYAVALRDGSLSHIDTTDGLMMQRIGDETTYVAERNGRNYRVIERNYAIFPQRSGRLTVPKVVFRGRIAPQSVPGNRSSADLLITRGRQVRMEGESVTLEVRPRPDNYSGEHWLPSPQLSLHETWSQEPLQFRIGEPITRTLVVQARGLDASQLPELAFSAIDSANVYPDQPSAETRYDGNWLVARLEQRLAIIPIEPGEITLPEMRLVWWDSENDREQVARLAERTITVSALEEIIDETAPPPTIPAETIAPQPSPSPSPPAIGSDADPRYWRWASLILMLLWLSTLLGWYRERRHNRRVTDNPVNISRPVDPKEARQALRLACRHNNPHSAARALLEWAQATWPEHPPTNLAELAGRVSNAREPLLALDRVLYAPASSEWQGNTLWRNVKSGLKAKSPAQMQTGYYDNELTPLYPRHT
jgi:hypothetical protein